MIRHALQTFSAVLLLLATSASAAPLQIGAVYALTFRDVDGRELATADGHATIITVVRREDEEKAHVVADRVPERYIGDQKYRYVTLVDFQGKLPGPVRGLTRVIIRNRLDAEAKELKPQYDKRKLGHQPREDLFVVPDFDGTAISRLGLAGDLGDVSVFLFDGHGTLTNRWTGVPPGDSLAKALAVAAL